MDLIDVYLGLGGNIGDTYAVMQAALQNIAAIDGVYQVEASQFYITSPVGGPKQADYLNGVCRLKTSLAAHDLFVRLQQIESALGKRPKPKNDPRIIDIDFLFYGKERYQTKELEIPHPRWKERLFVLIPLSDLVTTLTIPSHTSSGFTKIDLPQFIDAFPNIHNETISLQKAKLAV